MKTHIFSIVLCIVSLLFVRSSSAQQIPSTLRNNLPASASLRPIDLLPPAGKNLQSNPTSSPGLLGNYNYPLEACFTYTFKLSIGANNKKTIIRDTYTDHDNPTYLAGYIEETSGSRSAFIQQLGFDGNLGWSATISIPASNVFFNKVRQLADGTIRVIGTISDANGSNPSILLASFSSTGALIWCKKLNPGGFEGAALAENSTGGIDFAAQDKTNLIYGRMNVAGNLVWMKKIQLLDSGHVVGITLPSYDKLFIAYGGMQNGKHKGVFLRINMNSGDIISRQVLGNDTENYIFHSMEYEYNTIDVSGIVSSNNGPYQLFRLLFRETGQDYGIQLFNVPGATFDTTAASSLASYARVVAFRPSQTDANVYVMKTMAEAGTGDQIDWSKKFSIPGNFSLTNLQRTFDGGFLVNTSVQGSASTTTGFLLKMDSAGIIKDCPGSNAAITSSKATFNSVTTNPVFQNSPSTLNSLSPQLSQVVAPSTFSCRSLSCPVRLPEDECLQSFIKEYRASEMCDLGVNIAGGDNELAFVGTMRPNPVNSLEDHTIFGKFDFRGKLLVRKIVDIGVRYIGTKVSKLRNGGYLVTGNALYRSAFSANDTGYRTICKYSAALDLIWMRALPYYQPYSEENGIVEGNDGSLYYSYLSDPGACQRTSLIKFNANGDLIWSKDYSIPTHCPLGYVGSITQDDDYVYVLNFSETGNLFMKIDKNSGVPVITKGLTIANANQRYFQTMAVVGNDILLKGIVSVPGIAGDILVKLSKNGDVISNSMLSFNNSYAYLPTVFTQNNEIVMTQGEFFVRLDQNFQVINSRRNNFSGATGYGICENSTGNIFMIGAFFFNDPYLTSVALRKYSPDGKLGSCFSDTLIFSQSSISIQSTEYPVITTASTVPFNTLPYSESTHSLQESRLLCGAANNCTQVSINSPAAVCNNQEFDITAAPNAGCTLPVIFSFNNSNLQVVSSTPTGVRVKFISSGSTIVTAKLNTGCTNIIATATIAGTIAANPIGLGPDDVICTGNSKVLHAGPGYINYKWDDMSTDSVRTITAPGTYFVEASDVCGHTFYDTIKVQEFVTAINIGADRTKCDNDTIRLNAPAGFTAYTWGPAYNITNISGQQTVVNPSVDTAYFVKAQVSPGCFAYDTVRIKVKYGTPVNLGADRSFCAGDTLVLNAGNGFVSYLWSTGVSGQSVKLTIAGKYSVTVFNSEGCPSRDTMEIMNVYSLPQPNLGNDFSICKDLPRTLDPGSFSTYTWNSGSVAHTIQAATPGWYWVKVTDNHNCRGTDSVRLLGINPPPVSFLPKDTAICSYETIEISALQNFDQYRWSNGSFSKTIPVSVAGNYWLEVKDRNSCIGRDTIQVKPKECMTGFYVPKAFTPRSTTGKNDIFKPLIFGNIVKYHFYIYNRYGELVFESTDPAKGWNGMVKGMVPDLHAFVWICHYRFSGAPEKTEKGSVILIR